jgi:hypothetical protein
MPPILHPIHKETSAALARYVLLHTEPDCPLVLKRFRKVIGEIPRSKFKSIIVEDDTLILEDTHGELIALPLDLSKPTVVHMPTDENMYMVALPLKDFLSLHLSTRTRIRYDNINL